ncbi:hypothetical protein MKI84_08390 [Ancylobacter sp. A5.8]|uniref:hypothetical protein n=1 Tax=Ancylobacter gelatini TaxID=2919920 RepID=UPI001F4E800E|nr:hypothetical protein [Ancylobacter gelatini]MCJ8142933.1 hypothetical protein [Ancylobacter gelatini]
MAGTATLLAAVLGAIGRGARSIDDLDAHLPIRRSDIHRTVHRLVLRKLIAREEAGTYQLTAQGVSVLEEGRVLRSGNYRPLTGRRAPNRDSFRQRAWNAMRLQPRFEVDDIVMLARRADDGNAIRSAYRFVDLLKRSGYVAVLPARAERIGSTSGARVFRLVRDTGEIAPMHREKLGVMSDLNTGEDFPCR